MSRNWDWIDKIEDTDSLLRAVCRLRRSLKKYLDEDEQSGCTAEECCPKLEPITKRHPVKKAIIKIQQASKGVRNQVLLPVDGMKLWERLRRCNKPHEGPRSKVAVYQAAVDLLDWAQETEERLHIYIDSKRNTGREEDSTSGPNVSKFSLQRAEFAKPYREQPGTVYEEHPNREDLWPYSTIYQDYLKKYPDDSEASPSTIRLAYSRYGDRF